MVQRSEIGVLLSLRDEATKKLTTFGDAVERNSKLIRGMGLAAVGMGVAIVGALGASTIAFAKAGDEIQKMALRTGFSVEAISELTFAAQLAGTSVQALETGFRRMASSIIDADQGLMESVRAFDMLGVSVESLLGLGMEQQFFILVEALGKVEDQTLKVALAQDVFGRSGTQLLPLLSEGTKGMEAMRQKARDLGIVFDQETADKAAVLVDSIVTLKASMSGLAFTIGAEIAPIITDLANKMADVTAGVRAWADEHPLLTRLLIATGAGVGGVSLAIGGTLLVLPQLVAGVRLLTGAFIALRSAQLGAIALSIASVGAAAAAAAAPIALFGAALATIPSIIRVLGTGGDIDIARGILDKDAVKKWEEGGNILEIIFADIKGSLKGFGDQFISTGGASSDAAAEIVQAAEDIQAKIDAMASSFNPGLTGALSEATSSIRFFATFARGDLAVAARAALETEEAFVKMNETIFFAPGNRSPGLDPAGTLTTLSRVGAIATENFWRDVADRQARIALEATDAARSALFARLGREFDIRKEHWQSTLREQRSVNDAEIAEEKRKFDVLRRQVESRGGPMGDPVRDELRALFERISLAGGLRDATTGRQLTGEDLLERGITKRNSQGNPVVNIFIDGDLQAGKTALKGV